MVPDGVPQVGCMVLATVGVEGAEGTLLITTSDEAAEVHPPASVTVKL